MESLSGPFYTVTSFNPFLMKKPIVLIAFVFAALVSAGACDLCKSSYNNANFNIRSAKVTFNRTLGQLEFVIEVEGKAGATTPKPVGRLDGAPVLGYVFPTTLKPEDVGFSATDGIVALALTSHPDFDDSPLWDENADGDFSNDGVVWHPHWVVLTKDDRVKGGLSVKEFTRGDKSVKLPPTAPDMPMFMDSPGFQVVTDANTIRVAVPAYRVRNNTSFRFDAVACYMEVSAPDGGHAGAMKMPMLGVYSVYSVLSKDLSLPYSVR
jgi:hypothetical protein